MRFPIRPDQIFATVACCLLTQTMADAQEPTSPPRQAVIADFDQPFLFAYGTWQDKAKTTDGIAIIAGVTNQGGAGLNVSIDLTENENGSPAMRVRTGPNNQMQSVRLILVCESDYKPVWQFDLPPSDGQWHWITPRDGASLQAPNSTEEPVDGPMEVDRVVQWQITGDWAGNVAADIQIDQVAVVAATKSMLQERQRSSDQKSKQAEEKLQEQNRLLEQFSERTENSPRVVRTSMAAADVVAIEILAGKMSTCKHQAYRSEPDDTIVQRKDQNGDVVEYQLVRGGETIGSLIGNDRNWLVTWERVSGDPLLLFVADDPENFQIRIDGNPAFTPVRVSRKSRVNGWAQGSRELSLHHTLYLHLSEPISAGSTMNVAMGRLNTQKSEATLTFDPRTVRSESVHVHQIGFRTDDPVKRAFVSCWLGTGGPQKQPERFPFSIVDDATGRVAHRGTGECHFPSSKPEAMARSANFNGTDVARMDFSDFRTAGRYRVVVDGVGCSYPFTIGQDVWTSAWRSQLRGLYNNRSGIELGPPLTNFRKPRDMNPEDGYRVTRSTYRAVEAGNEAFEQLVAGDTGEPAPGWGGYHDAGDWNPRRVTHMRVTMAMLELFDQFPERLRTFDLNIPKDGDLPDMLAEAVFEFSCFRRLQLANGGVGMGLESRGDPRPMETSWHNSFPSYAYAPDYLSSWCYASVAARLSRLIEPFDAGRAADFLESGKRAMAFAELDFDRDEAAGLTKDRPSTWEATDYRNLAALELYRTTRDERYHDVFLENTVLTADQPELFRYGTAIQRDHAFHYARLPPGMGDDGIKTKAIAAIERLAVRGMEYASKNAFNVTSVDPWKPQFIGFYSTADAYDMTRAHALTGKLEYLIGAVQATQFQSGCNPNNLVYTTGVGANPVKHVFKLDARFTGQPVPEGLTPYGNIDFEKWNDEGTTWPIKWVIGNVTQPNPYAWPTHEAYWDLGGWPMLEEFTVDAWTPNVLVWGYLAFR
ncbi:Endoglucanase D precursor [Rubripirellula tenax]|uniref:Endoglucanase D n=1 Tax=Rubripirellula tenax TaxID=2528015 RepID=A0A5C6FJS7_9BACT|nr:glycoside hydrolase family 9 protein [Rubripirellula tenax]TWU59994.1 Endoglucanase D precursor [Rubripirellula tenax]